MIRIKIFIILKFKILIRIMKVVVNKEEISKVGKKLNKKKLKIKKSTGAILNKMIQTNALKKKLDKDQWT